MRCCEAGVAAVAGVVSSGPVMLLESPEVPFGADIAGSFEAGTRYAGGTGKEVGGGVGEAARLAAGVLLYRWCDWDSPGGLWYDGAGGGGGGETDGGGGGPVEGEDAGAGLEELEEGDGADCVRLATSLS